MLRVLVVVLHASLALLMVALGVLLGWQGLLNRAWEQGFYGETSFPTQLMLASAVFYEVLALAEGVLVVGFAARRRWASTLLLGVAVVMLIWVPPLRLVGVITAAAVLLETWSRARSQRRADGGPGG